MERRRMRGKPSFGKRMMVTILSLVMLLGLFVPGFAVGAEEIIPGDVPVEPFQSEAAKALEQKVTLFLLTYPQPDPTALEEYNALVQEVGTADYLTDKERLELQTKLSAYAVATIPEGDTGGTLLPDQSYILVKKTFSGITADMIPAGFSIVLSKSETETWRLTKDNATIEGNGLVWSWRINNTGTGTYTVTESGAEIDNYTLVANGLDAVEVKASSELIEDTNPGTSQGGGTQYTVYPGKVFVGHNQGTEETIIISFEHLNETTRLSLEDALSKLNSWKVSADKVKYYHIGELQYDVVYGADRVKFKVIEVDDVTYIDFIDQSNYNKYANTVYNFVQSQNGDIQITNTYTPKKGNLTIKKEFAGFDEADTDRPDVTVNVHNLDGSLMETITLNNSNNWTKTYEGLPVGFYKVEEKSPVVDDEFAGKYKLTSVKYSPGADNDTYMSAKVTDGGNTTATITNTYTKLVGNLTVTKTFEGLPEGTYPESVTVEVTGPYNFNKTITLPENGNWSHTFSSLPVGDYTVKETAAGTVTDYKLIGVTVGGTVGSNVGTEGIVNVVKDNTVAIGIINKYELDVTDITLSKVVDSDYEADITRDFEFEITIDGIPYKADGKNVTLKNGDTATIPDVTIGSEVEIIEVLGDAADYFNVDFARNGTEVVTSNPTSIVFDAGAGDSVVVTNTRKTSTITLKKMVEGNMISYDEKFSFVDGEGKELAQLAHEETHTFTVPMGVPVTIQENLEKYNTTVTIDGEPIKAENKTVTFTPTAAEHEVVYTNAHSITIATGIITDSMPYILLISAALLGGLVLILSKRRQMF